MRIKWEFHYGKVWLNISVLEYLNFILSQWRLVELSDDVEDIVCGHRPDRYEHRRDED